MNYKNVNNQKNWHTFIIGGNADIVTLLLDNSANLELCDESKQYPVHLAASRGHIQVNQYNH